MANPICIFCGSNMSPESREDVLPRWVARTFPPGRQTRLGREGGKNAEMIDKRRPHKRRDIGEGTFGLLTRGACQRCNNGWMSALEQKTKPILEPLLRGESSLVSEHSQGIIARWALKTSLMYEYGLFHAFGKQRTVVDKPLFGWRDRAALFENKPLPPGTFVFLGRFIDDELAAWIADPDYAEVSAASGVTLTCIKHTFAINHLVVQVLAFRSNKKDAPIKSASLMPDARWFDSTFRIHPADWSAIMWPPRIAFDAHAITAFADRRS